MMQIGIRQLGGGFFLKDTKRMEACGVYDFLWGVGADPADLGEVRIQVLF
jgi:hypothetical protein